MRSQKELERLFYNREAGWIDGTELFHRLCAQIVPRGGNILEIGSGPSNRTSRFLATLGQLHGLDPDPDVIRNDALTTAHVLEGDTFPFADGQFDACVSNFVVEHIAAPGIHLREVSRVLKAGGAYVFRTPNRWHYVYTIASLTPHWFHRMVANRLRALPSTAHEPYPTVYAMNTAQLVKRYARETEFALEHLEFVESEPSYGRFSRLAFLVMTIYERIVNSSNLFEQGRAILFAVLRKRVLDAPTGEVRAITVPNSSSSE